MPKNKISNPVVTQRQRRVGELLRRTLAELSSDGSLKIPDIVDVPVTVSAVDISPDLTKASVFVMPLGGVRTDEVVQALNGARREIRKQVNGRVHLKRSPQLQFFADPMFDQLDHMQRLFSREDVKRDIAVSHEAVEE